MSQENESAKRLFPETEPPESKVIQAEELFKGQREVYIDHAGERYRLRITRRNKLIFQK